MMRFTKIHSFIHSFIYLSRRAPNDLTRLLFMISNKQYLSTIACCNIERKKPFLTKLLIPASESLSIVQSHFKVILTFSNFNMSSSTMLKSRVSLFLILPFAVGSFAFIMSYGKKKLFDESGEVNFDTDFIIPFLLTFVLVSVVMIQTKGFSSEAKSIVLWPKIIKKKKIMRKTVIVDDDGNEIKDEKILKKFEQRLKEAKKKI